MHGTCKPSSSTLIVVHQKSTCECLASSQILPYLKVKGMIVAVPQIHGTHKNIEAASITGVLVPLAKCA